MINKEAKTKIIQAFGKSANDVGSSQVQVALLSERIRQISEHLKKSPKDFHSQRGLVILVGKRRSFLNYLKKNQAESYANVLSSLKAHGYM